MLSNNKKLKKTIKNNPEKINFLPFLNSTLEKRNVQCIPEKKLHKINNFLIKQYYIAASNFIKFEPLSINILTKRKIYTAKSIIFRKKYCYIIRNYIYKQNEYNSMKLLVTILV